MQYASVLQHVQSFIVPLPYILKYAKQWKMFGKGQEYLSDNTCQMIGLTICLSPPTVLTTTDPIDSQQS